MREEIKDPGRLEHMLAAIDKVQEYTNGIDKESLKNDSMRLHATAYNIQIIGEAVYKLTKEFKEAHPETPWRLIEKMRHILVHDYFAVDFEFLWIVVQDDIQPLKLQIEGYLRELKSVSNRHEENIL